MIAGADWYKDQWILATEDRVGQTRIQTAPSVRELVADPDLELVVIDLPIGLLDIGQRKCDQAARALLQTRRSSVFDAPIRPMLSAADYEHASRIRFDTEGKKCSRQTYGILPLVRELDTVITPELQERVVEGHPEVSLTAIAGGSMNNKKNEPAGQAERISYLIKPFPDLLQSMVKFGRPGAISDILDAYALLWSARRVMSGRALEIPADPKKDTRGLKMAVTY